MSHRLYLDCDGVLADFDRAFVAHFGIAPRAREDAVGSAPFWRDLRDVAPPFFRSLPLMPDARDLFAAVEHMRPIILTGCPRGEWAQPQKLAWAAEHFPGTPMIVCMAHDKRLYCKPGDILVDDRTKYRDLWEEAGGVFVHHTSAAESIAALSELVHVKVPA